jgi:hypothetical protein
MAFNNSPDVENDSGFYLGDILLAPAFGQLLHPITGIVEHIYERSLLIEVMENDKEDQTLINEMNHRAVVAMTDVKVIKKGPKPKKKPEDPNAKPLKKPPRKVE